YSHATSSTETYTLSLHDALPILKIGSQNVIGQDSLYSSAVYDANTKELIIKFVNYNDQPVEANLQLDTKKKIEGSATKITLANGDLNVVNRLEEPLKIKQQTEQVNYKNKNTKYTFPPYSITVIRVSITKEERASTITLSSTSHIRSSRKRHAYCRRRHGPRYTITCDYILK